MDSFRTVTITCDSAPIKFQPVPGSEIVGKEMRSGRGKK